jgi:hypothetical protein
MTFGSSGFGRIAIALGVGAAMRQGGWDIPPKAFYVLERRRAQMGAEVVGTYGSIEAASGAIDDEVGEQHGRFDDYAIATVRTTPRPFVSIVLGVAVFLGIVLWLGTFNANLVVVLAAAAGSAFVAGGISWILLKRRFQLAHASEWRSMGAG